MAIRLWISQKDICALVATRKAIKKLRHLIAAPLGVPPDAPEVAFATAALQKFYRKLYAKCLASQDPERLDVHTLVKVPRFVYAILKTLGFCLFSTQDGDVPLMGPGGHPVCADGASRTGLHLRERAKAGLTQARAWGSGKWYGGNVKRATRAQSLAEQELEKAKRDAALATAQHDIVNLAKQHLENLPSEHKQHQEYIQQKLLGPGHGRVEDEKEKSQAAVKAAEEHLQQVKITRDEEEKKQKKEKERQAEGKKRLQCITERDAISRTEGIIKQKGAEMLKKNQEKQNYEKLAKQIMEAVKQKKSNLDSAQKTQENEKLKLDLRDVQTKLNLANAGLEQKKRQAQDDMEKKIQEFKKSLEQQEQQQESLLRENVKALERKKKIAAGALMERKKLEEDIESASSAAKLRKEWADRITLENAALQRDIQSLQPKVLEYYDKCKTYYEKKSPR